jgi:hypothetical protein
MYSSASLRRRNALAPILYTTKLPTAHARCRLWRARVTVAMALRPLLLRCDCRRLEGISPTVLRLRPPPCLRLQLAQRKRSGWALCSIVLLTVPARGASLSAMASRTHGTIQGGRPRPCMYRLHYKCLDTNSEASEIKSKKLKL